MMPWSEFHFLRPWWLFLLPLGLLLFFLPAFRSIKKNPWAKVIEPHFLSHLLQNESTQKRSLFSTMLWSFFFMLLIVALAGPTLQKISTDISFNKAPLIVCVEVSSHMTAKDIAPSRLKRAIFKLEDVLKRYPGAEVSLIAFAGDAHLVVPFSHDYNTVLSLAKILSPDLMPERGVNLSNALTLAEDLVKRNPKAKILIMTSTNVDEKAMSIVEKFKASDIPIMLWAFATDMGAPMESADGQFDKNRQGNINVSKIRLDFIKDLSMASNVLPIMFTQDNHDVTRVVKSMEAAGEVLSKKELFYDSWYDLGPYCLALAMGVFLASYFFLKERAWFLGMLFLLPSFDVKADISDWFLRKDQQAEISLKEGDAKTAAELFSDDMRKGSAYYKAKMYDEAIEHLSRVATSDGAYNLGNAYAQKGKLDLAIAAYEQAIKQDPANEDARANKELLEKLKQQQDQKKSQSGDKNQEQKEESSKDSQSQKSKEEEEQKQNQEQEPKKSSSDQKNDQKNGQASDAQKEQSAQTDQENKPEKNNKEPGEEKNMTNPKEKRNEEKEQKKMPGSSDKDSLDQESRYYFDQMQPNSSLYLKRKFLKESVKQKEAQ